jgi:anti-anti-sigma factor
VIQVVEHTDAVPSLQVQLESTGTRCLLLLRGHLCGSSIAALEAQVDQLGCMPCEEVIVDMQYLTRMDPVGANVILGLYHYVVGRGGALRLRAVRAEVAATLHATAGTSIPIDFS